LFDLANLSSNNAYSSAQDEDLLERYFQTRPNAALRHAFVSMKCASLLREVLWGAVQQLKSTIEFDYASYTAAYLARWDAMVVDLTPP
jgi:thiamine kinase-like enzyme